MNKKIKITLAITASLLIIIVSLMIIFIPSTFSCKIRGGKLTAAGGLFGPYNYHCIFPYKDAGKKCTKSEQCQGLCLMTILQLESQGIPHFTNSNVFYYDGRIADVSSKYGLIINNPLQTISLPKNIDTTGVCQEYPLKNCRGAYELNGNISTLKSGGCMIF